MTTPTTPGPAAPTEGAHDFSLVLGGPLFQLLRRAHLTGDAMDLLRQRIVVLALLAWLPLAVLTAVRGTFAGDAVAVPFLLDVEVHVRFLLALPILVGAELVVHRRMRPLVDQFLERGLVPARSRARFDAAIASVFRLRNSVLAEVLLLALVFGVGIPVVWRHYVSLDAATWCSVPSASGTTLTPAGIWYAAVSLPLFQFLLVRWYYRLFLWTRFLWQVSRIELDLVATHPDRVGGLSFLANTAHAFGLVAAAHGTLLAGQIGTRILHVGASLTDFQAEIGVIVAVLLCTVLGPLLFFSGQLADTKRRGAREYGTLAERYAREFERKWLRGGAPPEEPLVGSADIQSLADLANAFEVVKGMRAVPVTRDGVLQLVLATLLPIAPLALTLMPLEELAARAVGLLF